MGDKWTTLILLLILCSTIVAISNIKPAKAEGPIVIKSDGSIEGTDKIERNGNYYYLTADIEFFKSSVGILIQRDSIIIDGKGFTIIEKESYSGRGVNISGRFNVTIQNLNIKGFSKGIYIYNLYSNRSSNNTIIGNTITGPSDNSYQFGIKVHQVTK